MREIETVRGKILKLSQDTIGKKKKKKKNYQREQESLWNRISDHTCVGGQVSSNNPTSLLEALQVITDDCESRAYNCDIQIREKKSNQESIDCQFSRIQPLMTFD
jgi:hypothetical protein